MFDLLIALLLPNPLCVNVGDPNFCFTFFFMFVQTTKSPALPLTLCASPRMHDAVEYLVYL